MAITAGPNFTDSLAIAARRERQQMWQAAQTVRAHVEAGENRDDLLACLGLSNVEAPDVETGGACLSTGLRRARAVQPPYGRAD